MRGHLRFTIARSLPQCNVIPIVITVTSNSHGDILRNHHFSSSPAVLRLMIGHRAQPSSSRPQNGLPLSKNSWEISENPRKWNEGNRKEQLNGRNGELEKGNNNEADLSRGCSGRESERGEIDWRTNQKSKNWQGRNFLKQFCISEKIKRRKRNIYIYKWRKHCRCLGFGIFLGKELKLRLCHCFARGGVRRACVTGVCI